MKQFLFILFLIPVFQSKTQIRQVLSQYMLHQQTFNPGFSDPETKFSFNGLYKRQWVTQDNFPEAGFIYGHYNFDETHGAGLLISNDLMNGVNQFEAAVNYVYNIPFSYEANFGMGLKVGICEQNLINKDLVYFDANDPVLNQSRYNNTHMNAGVGFSVTSSQLNVHLSAPYLFGNNFLNRSKTYSVQYNHIFLNLGYKYRQSDWFIIYPTIFVNYLEGAPLHGKFNFNVLTSQLVWTGLGVSTDLTLNLTVGIFAMGGLRVIYSFDATGLSKHNTTGVTHEFSVNYAKTIDQNPFHKKRTRRITGGYSKKR